MEFKKGDKVHCVGRGGTYEIVADEANPVMHATEAPFFKKRELTGGYDFILAQVDISRDIFSIFLYVTKNQLRKQH